MDQRLTNMLRNAKHSKGKIFFSETGEDILLQQLFRSKVGRYIDIGSGQPVIGSNSFLFYKMGWNGVCIDPQPNLALSYKILRPRDIFLPYLVGINEFENLYEFENKLLSTTNPKVAAYHKSNGLNYKIRKHKSVLVKDYLPQRISPDEDFFISIDIEGAEFDVIRQVDFENQRPRAILIELWGNPWNTRSRITSFLYKNNYQLFAYTGLTALFIPEELETKTIKFRSNLSVLDEIA